MLLGVCSRTPTRIVTDLVPTTIRFPSTAPMPLVYVLFFSFFLSFLSFFSFFLFFLSFLSFFSFFSFFLFFLIFFLFFLTLLFFVLLAFFLCFLFYIVLILLLADVLRYQVRHYQRDGLMTVNGNHGSAVNYEPNIFGGPTARPEFAIHQVCIATRTYARTYTHSYKCTHWHTIEPQSRQRR